MWVSFALTVAAGVVVLAIGFVGGYTFRWYRSRIKVSLATHVQQSWSDRNVHMSISNHGNTAIILDSWTVHMPLDDLLPGLGEKVREAEGDDKPPPQRRFSTLRRVARRTCSRLYRRGRIGIQNELSRNIARSMLSEVHIRHQLLDPGTTHRVEPRESTVRTFPRISGNPQEPKIASDNGKPDHHPVLPCRWSSTPHMGLANHTWRRPHSNHIPPKFPAHRRRGLVTRARRPHRYIFRCPPEQARTYHSGRPRPPSHISKMVPSTVHSGPPSCLPPPAHEV